MSEDDSRNNNPIRVQRSARTLWNKAEKLLLMKCKKSLSGNSLNDHIDGQISANKSSLAANSHFSAGVSQLERAQTISSH